MDLPYDVLESDGEQYDSVKFVRATGTAHPPAGEPISRNSGPGPRPRPRRHHVIDIASSAREQHPLAAEISALSAVSSAATAAAAIAASGATASVTGALLSGAATIIAILAVSGVFTK